MTSGRSTKPLATALAVLVLAACGNTTPDPRQLLRDAAHAMAQVRTLQVDVAFGPGAKVQGFDLVAASGKVKRPADSDTVGKVRSGGGNSLIEPELITAGGKSCLRLTALFGFQSLSASEAAGYPSAGRLFDPNTGVTAAMAKPKSASIDGSQAVDGHDSWRVSATYAPDVLSPALAPVTLTQDVSAEIWVDKASKVVRKVTLSGNLFDPQTPSSVDAHLHDFDAPLSITAPC